MCHHNAGAATRCNHGQIHANNPYGFYTLPTGNNFKKVRRVALPCFFRRSCLSIRCIFISFILDSIDMHIQQDLYAPAPCRGTFSFDVCLLNTLGLPVGLHTHTHTYILALHIALTQQKTR